MKRVRTRVSPGYCETVVFCSGEFHKSGADTEPQCRRWYDRKVAKTSNVIATKALACKLAKAAWHVMSQGTDYDSQRMFGQAASTK